jgi:hypothetical protein
MDTSPAVNVDGDPGARVSGFVGFPTTHPVKAAPGGHVAAVPSDWPVKNPPNITVGDVAPPPYSAGGYTGLFVPSGTSLKVMRPDPAMKDASGILRIPAAKLVLAVRTISVETAPSRRVRIGHLPFQIV